MSSLRPGRKPPSGQDTIARTRLPSPSSSAPHISGRTRMPLGGLEGTRLRPFPAQPSSYSSSPSKHFSGRSVSSSKIPPMGSSSLPVSASQRRPSDPRQRTHSRPPLTHQSQPWGSASSRPGPSNIPPPASSVPRPLRSPPSNLTRDMSGSSQPGIRSRNNSGGTSSSSSATRAPTSLELDRTLTESPAELNMAKQAEVTSAHTVTIYPELDRYRGLAPASDPYGPAHPDMLFRLATEGMHPPPTPYLSGSTSQVSGISASPSTRFSESPGPGSYSRDTTPTSISSQSPGILASGRMPSAPRMRQPVRVRTGSFGKEGPGAYSQSSSVPPTQTLSAIRESLNSSSSSSNGTLRKEKAKKKRLSPTPPSPPPRKSSQGFKESGDEYSSPEKPRKSTEEHARSRPSSSKSNRAKTLSPSPVPVPALPKSATGSPQPPQRPAPPSRPSRDGTPDLQTQLGVPLPIIQSNLSRVQSSDHLGISYPTPPQPSRPQNDQVQPGPSLQPAASTSCSHIPSLSRTESEEARPSREQVRTARTPSPNVSTFRTRFPLFGRRTRAAPVAAADAVPTGDKKDTPTVRKGPVAGTGHEGYGRMGASRRRSSSVSNFLRSNQSSQESLSSAQSQDPFLRDRMSPVVIAGGEIVENQNTGYDMARTGSNTSASAGPSMLPPSLHRPRTDSLSSREDRTTLWPSAIPRGSRRPSESSDSEAVMKSTLAFRRSVQRLQSPEQAQVRVPRPIVVRPARQGVPPSITSADTLITTDDSTTYSRGRPEAAAPAAAPAKKLTKRPRSPRKWNLFGRSQSQPATSKKALQSTSTVAVTVEAFPVEKAKPVAYYAMIDSSEQEDGDMDVEDILLEARMPDCPVTHPPIEPARMPSRSVSESQQPVARAAQPPQRPPRPDAPHFAQAPPLQQAPVLQQTSPLQHAPNTALPVPGVRSGRPSRLPQVGRIPKVVSARADQSPKSFSRPFNRTSVLLSSTVSIPLPSVDVESIAKGATPTESATPELVHDGSTVTHQTPEIGFLGNGAEFFTMASRKDSQTTSGTSSSGFFSFADATAIVPDPSAPLAEDEIWDEYNDLLEDGLAAKVRASTTSSHGMPFHLEAAARRIPVADGTMMAPLESPTIAGTFQQSQSIDAALSGRPPVASSIYSTDVVVETSDEHRASQPPATPFSVSEFVSGYGDRNSVGKAKKAAAPQRKSGGSLSKSVKKPRTSDGSVYSQVSEDNSPISQVNLRVGSMTVSKWLTFGHVLFSPARDDMVLRVSPPNGHSVLVIDGLGNDDWSFYAAETYPAATFFNLSPRAPLPTDPNGTTTAFPATPSNHHQVQFSASGTKLPFQADIFSTVVYRFPTAAPASHYRAIINEARRVLKPGGYLELSILDVDLNNMGPRTRRAIRRLKEQTHTHAPDLHLGSTADLILRLLGTRGFTDVKSCRVGIPAASPVPRGGSVGGSVGGSNDVSVPIPKKPKDQRSLAEMINDESPVADESITSMVARVGRWWHSRCYGDAAVDPTVPSTSTNSSTSGISNMWMDRALLAECEEWRTNLKLTVCYARVPDIKRVASI